VHVVTRDAETGVVLATLRNGVRVTALAAKFDTAEVTLTLNAGCGPGPDEAAALGLGVNAMMDSGLVAGDSCGAGTVWSSEVVSRYCNAYGIECSTSISAEGVHMEVSWTTSSDGETFGGTIEAPVPMMDRCLEVLRLTLEDPVIDASAFERAVRDAVLSWELSRKDLSSAAWDDVVSRIVPGDTRFGQADPALVRSLDRGACRDALARLLRPDNLEIVIIGDFDEDRVFAALDRYIGSLPASGPPCLAESAMARAAANAAAASSSTTAEDGGGRVDAPRPDHAIDASGTAPLQFPDPAAHRPVAPRFAAPPPATLGGAVAQLETVISDDVEQAMAYIVFPDASRWGECTNGDVVLSGLLLLLVFFFF
jgi:hypothetical protein